MDNTYISKFINSTDIRKHLQEIDYNFSVPEYAYLIWQCKTITLNQRHLAFQTLLDSTESCIVKTSNCREGWDLHQTIKDYVALENKLVNTFLTPEENRFYVAEWCELGEWHGGDCFFDNQESAYSYAIEYAEKNPINSFRIRKHYIDNSTSFSGFIEVTYNSKGETMGIDRYE